MNFLSRLNSAESKSKVKSSVKPADLKKILNKNIQELVKKLQQSFRVKSILTEGYNNGDADDGEGAGVEVHFEGTSNSIVAYGTKALVTKDILLLSSIMKNDNGIETELTVGEEGEFVLILLGDADK